MDDPWANAWGESSKTTLPEPVSQASAWSAPSVSAIHGDHEDDLSLPSWSVQPTVQWTDPDNAETSLWTSDESTVWNPIPSTFDRISLPNDPSESELRVSSPPPQDVPEYPPTHPTLSIPHDDERSPPVSPTLKSTDPLSYSPPPHSPGLPPPLNLDVVVEDPDGFGTFETADDEIDSERWSPKRPALSLPLADAAAWGGGWEESATTTTTTISEPTIDGATSAGLDDAWEVARRQKENQDRHVPPELLASMLREFQEVSNDLWPESALLSSSPHDTKLSTDMEEHLGLGSVVQRLIPEDLMLPPNVSFSKTFTSKQMSEALKLTRHAPLTRFSPMAFYMSSKGLTSWEASVKAKPNIVSEDFTPAGWKILEGPKGDAVTTDDSKKKPNGGLLSFFGRRTTNPSVDTATTTRSGSPISLSGTSSGKPGTSPRPSVDSARPSSNRSQMGGSTAPSSPVVPTFGAAPPTTQNLEASSVPDTAITSPTMYSAGESNQEAETISQPSAVSRFLGRFSTRSTKSSSRDSLALSNDDLEFLSDVPTVETHPDDSIGLDALSLMIKSPPLPTVLPAPLKPPPRASPQPFGTNSSMDHPTDDFMSFFETPSGSSLSALTTAPTPPVRSALTQFSSPSAPVPPPNKPPPTARVSDQPSQDSEVYNDQTWPSFDYPATQAPMSKPVPTKRSFVPIMTSSTSKTTSSTPPLLPKPTSGFVLPPPPPSSIRRTPISSNAGSISNILPPPPTSRSLTPLQSSNAKSTTPTSTIMDDDDDFADFLSSPSQTTQTGTTLSFGAFASATDSIERSSATHYTAHNKHLDNLNDFISPGPPPPAKSLPQTPPLSTLNNPVSNNIGQASNIKGRRPSRAADHARTLSLLESAAARGRWLAPPSPLPEALPPPDSNKSDFFSGGSTMQAQQAHAAASLSGSFSSPTLHPNTSQETPPLWDFTAPTNGSTIPLGKPIQPLMQSNFSAPPRKAQAVTQPTYPQNNAVVPPSGPKTGGGLSAQDLSFFEGL